MRKTVETLRYEKASCKIIPTPESRSVRRREPRNPESTLGLCQLRGGPVEVIRPGDSVFFEPGEEHWHGAAPNRFMTHLEMQEADDESSPVTWGGHVTDEEYGAAPPIDDIRNIIRFAQEARKANRALVDLLGEIGRRKNATPAQIALS
jgi:hypothetical protein